MAPTYTFQAQNPDSDVESEILIQFGKSKVLAVQHRSVERAWVEVPGYARCLIKKDGLPVSVEYDELLFGIHGGSRVLNPPEKECLEVLIRSRNLEGEIEYRVIE